MEIESPEWATDQALFASLQGGQAIIDWFGYCPDFHDGTLERLQLSNKTASLSVRSFRMTSKVSSEGFYVPDRHASVTLLMRGVTGVRLDGDADSIISELMIRRLPRKPDRSEWQSCGGPEAGDIEIAFDTAIGLYGAIYAKELEFELRPLPELESA
jgi:hypothetical protein